MLYQCRPYQFFFPVWKGFVCVFSPFVFRWHLQWFEYSDCKKIFQVSRKLMHQSPIRRMIPLFADFDWVFFYKKITFFYISNMYPKWSPDFRTHQPSGMSFIGAWLPPQHSWEKGRNRGIDSCQVWYEQKQPKKNTQLLPRFVFANGDRCGIERFTQFFLGSLLHENLQLGSMNLV